MSRGSIPAAARGHTELGSPQVLLGGAAEGGKQAGTARSGRLYTLNIGWHVSQRRWCESPLLLDAPGRL